MATGLTDSEDRIDLLGVAIDNLSMREALERIAELATGAGPPAKAVVTPNVDHLVKLQEDAEFREVYEQATLVLADGMPLLWAARLLKTPLKEKVSGSDLFVEFARVAASRGLKLFFMGGRPGAADKAAAVLCARFPGLQVVGTSCPPMGFHTDADQNRALVEEINASGAQVLFVGLGAPKQEKWIHAHAPDLAVPVAIGVGVSFEFVAGMVRRAPVWMQRAGLEWGWRLAMEPRRLWRRYLVEDRRFAGLVLRQLRRQRARG